MDAELELGMGSEQDAAARSRAAEVYAAWCVEREDGVAPSFEGLREAHPELERELDALRAQERAAAGPLGKARPTVVLEQSLLFVPPLLEALDELAAPAERTALEAGSVLGDFELVRLLGRGGMGEVWEARQRSLQRPVALKLLSGEGVLATRLASFERESQVLARVEHDDIVTVYGTGCDGGWHWIAQELVPEGATLESLLGRLRGAAEPPEAWCDQIARFFVRVAEALQFAHECGVLHRDLKPANVLVTRDGRPRVADFGLALLREAAESSEVGRFAGTIPYMSPEQVAAWRWGEPDERSDVFSLGVMLYECVALRRPFDSELEDARARELAVLEAIATRTPAPLRSCAPWAPLKLETICQRALEKARSLRYPGMAEFAADLRRFLEDRPLSVPPTDPTADSTRGASFDSPSPQRHWSIWWMPWLPRSPLPVSNTQCQS